MPTERKFTIAHLVMVLIFCLGLGVRFFDLGAMPLPDSEARAALGAFRGSEPGVDAGYAALTGLLMSLFGATNFAARFVPAVAGAMLVILPFLLRRRIGTLPAMLFSAGLALDPLLVSVSRVAGGPMLALGLLVAIALLRIAEDAGPGFRVPGVLIAVLAGLALLSGPDVFFGLLVLGLSYSAYRAFAGEFDLFSSEKEAPGSEARDFRAAFGALVLTTLLVGTGFMLRPQGLAAFASSVPVFLLGWAEGAGVTAGQILVTLLAYQLIPLVFAGVHAYRSWRDGSNFGKFLSIWFLSGLLLLLVYPGRQVSGLVWTSVPLWGLAALEIGRARYWPARFVYRPLVLASALVVFFISFWTNLSSLSYVVPDSQQFVLRLMIIAGTLILGVLSISLVNLGWDRDSAASGTVWGFAAVMLLGMFAGVWGTSSRNAVGLREPWMASPGPGEAEMLELTLESLGNWFNGSSKELDIIYSVESSALDWALRAFPNARPGIPVPGEDLPEVIITSTDPQEIRLESAYRGQALIWRVYTDWSSMGRTEWSRWILFREAPAANEKIIVWVRADLFLAYGGDDFTDLFPLDALDEDPSQDFVPLEDPLEALPGP